MAKLPLAKLPLRLSWVESRLGRAGTDSRARLGPEDRIGRGWDRTGSTGRDLMPAWLSAHGPWLYWPHLPAPEGWPSG